MVSNGNGNGEVKTEILILVDDEGKEHDFALLDRFIVDMNEYAILVPVSYIEQEEDDDQVDFAEDAYIFRIEPGEENEETMVEVEDEDEWHRVATIWEERVHSLEEDDSDDYC